MSHPIRIGLVGAGANTRTRHIPGFRDLSGVEIVGVVNSSLASTARAAAEFGIPKTYASWRELIADPAIDAICIGTWPNLHAEVTCAALEAGKHVLTEARMASTAAEARQMLAVAQAHPKLIAQVVPSPFGLAHGEFIAELISQQYIGILREVVVLGVDDTFWDYSKELHWRQDATKSGINILTLGILHETLSRWIPAPTRVLAQAQIFEPTRFAAGESGKGLVTVPEMVSVLTQYPGGARGVYHFSGSVLHGPGKQIHLYGSKGTIKYFAGPPEQIFSGRAGDPEMIPLDIPPEKLGKWRVEAEFIGAIRGEESVRLTDFATGVKYMEFTDAVTHSAASGTAVELS